MKKITVYAVWNIDLNVPCVQVDDDGNVLGVAIFTSDYNDPRKMAITWMHKNFGTGKRLKKLQKDLGIRIKKLSIQIL